LVLRKLNLKSTLNNPTPANIILDKISLRYHDSIMAASGPVAEKAGDEAIKEGGYILVIEGAIPTDDRFCTISGRPFREIVLEAAQKAEVIVAPACICPRP
jgi:hydrogenase small subunit